MRRLCEGASKGEEACPRAVTMEIAEGEEAHVSDIV